jgi:hypothetical protein
MLRFIRTDSGVRCGFFCDECDAEIVETGIATRDSDDPRAPIVFLHKGTCDELRADRVGSFGWEDIDVLLVRLEANFGSDREGALKSAAILSSDELGQDQARSPSAPSGAIGTRS